MVLVNGESMKPFKNTFPPTTNKSFKFWLLTIISLLSIISVIILANKYIKLILISLEYTPFYYNFFIFLSLYILVSFPMTWGYILLNLTAGYLFGIIYGLFIIVSCALFGISVSHFSLRYLLPSSTFFAESQNFKTLVRLVEGAEGFKIIALTRLTPIPFGLQNTFFAMCRLTYSRYVLASISGMLPTQALHVAIGSTLRSMQDVVSSSMSTSFLLAGHVAFLVLLFVCLARRAQAEFKRSLTNASPTNVVVLNL